MNILKRYKKRTIIKSIVLPLLITAAVCCAVRLAAPYIESRLPDASAYSQAIQAEVADE